MQNILASVHAPYSAGLFLISSNYSNIRLGYVVISWLLLGVFFFIIIPELPVEKTHPLIHLQEELYLGHGGSGVFPGNTEYEVGIEPGWGICE